MICYSLAKHARFCEPGIRGLWPFPDDIFNFFVGDLVENNWGKNGLGSCQLRILTWFSLIWSQFQFLVTIDYFLGKKHIGSMLYASTQPERELLTCTIRPRILIRQRVLNYPIALHVVQKSVEFSGGFFLFCFVLFCFCFCFLFLFLFSGVGSLTH